MVVPPVGEVPGGCQPYPLCVCGRAVIHLLLSHWLQSLRRQQQEEETVECVGGRADTNNKERVTHLFPAWVIICVPGVIALP